MYWTLARGCNSRNGDKRCVGLRRWKVLATGRKAFRPVAEKRIAPGVSCKRGMREAVARVGISVLVDRVERRTSQIPR